MTIYDETETPKTPILNLQDGNGEHQPSAVYVNDQDGNGERKIWPTGTGPAFLSLGDDNTGDTTSNESGVYFLTGAAMDGVTVRLSQQVGSSAAWPDQLVIKPEVDGTVMTTVDISSNAPGDEVDITPSGGLSASSYYTVNLRMSDGSLYGRGRWESPTFPYSNEYFDVEGGVYSAGGSTTVNNRYNFSAIAPINPV